MKLVIISHTAHYKNSEGEIVGWGPTINEINNLLPLFEKIYHCAFLHQQEEPPKSSLSYTSSNIEFIPLPPSGGKGLNRKLSVLKTLPETLQTVKQILEISDVFQFRAPTGMGIYMIPYLSIFCRKKGWFKYAGDWNQKKPPLGYAVQRWFLKLQYRQVTINGSWPNQPENILTFENPCLTPEDREKGKEIVKTKTLQGGSKICFVGNLTRNKGLDIFMDALLQMDHKWEEIHVVGDGPLRKEYQDKFPGIIFHGFLPKEKVHEVYLNCHFIILPSLSEGFPKVIAEGMNYGCIPVVSDVSGIGQYVIDGENGFLIKPITRSRLISRLEKAKKLSNEVYRKMIINNYDISSKFTFEAYIKHIRHSIF